MKTPPKLQAFFLPALASCSLLTVSPAQAETIAQAGNAGASTGWNTPSIWGGSAPSPGNDYVTTATGTLTLIYTLNGIAWNQAQWSVRDVVDSVNGVSTTFDGDRLILQENTSLNARSTGGSTQTVNLVFDGGMYRGNVGSAGATRSTSLAGTIGFNTPTTIAAMGTLSPNDGNSFTLNINSTVTGGAGNVLQLTMNGGMNRTAFVNLNGDLSGYFGTIYAGVSTAGINAGVADTSRFSITSDAVNATVQLDYTTTNFGYDLVGDVTFGALRLGSGEGTEVAAGIYDLDALNGLAGGNYFHGGGTITVVPEPSTVALCAVGLMGGIALLRLRPRRTVA